MPMLMTPYKIMRRLWEVCSVTGDKFRANCLFAHIFHFQQYDRTEIRGLYKQLPIDQETLYHTPLLADISIGIEGISTCQSE